LLVHHLTNYQEFLLILDIPCGRYHLSIPLHTASCIKRERNLESQHTPLEPNTLQNKIMLEREAVIEFTHIGQDRLMKHAQDAQKRREPAPQSCGTKGLEDLQDLPLSETRVPRHREIPTPQDKVRYDRHLSKGYLGNTTNNINSALQYNGVNSNSLDSDGEFLVGPETSELKTSRYNLPDTRYNFFLSCVESTCNGELVPIESVPREYLTPELIAKACRLNESACWRIPEDVLTPAIFDRLIKIYGEVCLEPYHDEYGDECTRHPLEWFFDGHIDTLDQDQRNQIEAYQTFRRGESIVRFYPEFIDQDYLLRGIGQISTLTDLPAAVLDDMDLVKDIILANPNVALMIPEVREKFWRVIGTEGYPLEIFDQDFYRELQCPTCRDLASTDKAHHEALLVRLALSGATSPAQALIENTPTSLLCSLLESGNIRDPEMLQTLSPERWDTTLAWAVTRYLPQALELVPQGAMTRELVRYIEKNHPTSFLLTLDIPKYLIHEQRAKLFVETDYTYLSRVPENKKTQTLCKEALCKALGAKTDLTPIISAIPRRFLPQILSDLSQDNFGAAMQTLALSSTSELKETQKMLGKNEAIVKRVLAEAPRVLYALPITSKIYTEKIALAVAHETPDKFGCIPEKFRTRDLIHQAVTSALLLNKSLVEIVEHNRSAQALDAVWQSLNTTEKDPYVVRLTQDVSRRDDFVGKQECKRWIEGHSEALTIIADKAPELFKALSPRQEAIQSKPVADRFVEQVPSAFHTIPERFRTPEHHYLVIRALATGEKRWDNRKLSDVEPFRETLQEISDQDLVNAIGKQDLTHQKSLWNALVHDSTFSGRIQHSPILVPQLNIAAPEFIRDIANKETITRHPEIIQSLITYDPKALTKVPHDLRHYDHCTSVYSSLLTTDNSKKTIATLINDTPLATITRILDDKNLPPNVVAKLRHHLAQNSHVNQELRSKPEIYELIMRDEPKLLHLFTISLDQVSLEVAHFILAEAPTKLNNVPLHLITVDHIERAILANGGVSPIPSGVPAKYVTAALSAISVKNPQVVAGVLKTISQEGRYARWLEYEGLIDLMTTVNPRALAQLNLDPSRVTPERANAISHGSPLSLHKIPENLRTEEHYERAIAAVIHDLSKSEVYRYTDKVGSTLKVVSLLPQDQLLSILLAHDVDSQCTFWRHLVTNSSTSKSDLLKREAVVEFFEQNLPHIFNQLPLTSSNITTSRRAELFVGTNDTADTMAAHLLIVPAELRTTLLYRSVLRRYNDSKVPQEIVQEIPDASLLEILMTEESKRYHIILSKCSSSQKEYLANNEKALTFIEGQAPQLLYLLPIPSSNITASRADHIVSHDPSQLEKIPVNLRTDGQLTAALKHTIKNTKLLDEILLGQEQERIAGLIVGRLNTDDQQASLLRLLSSAKETQKSLVEGSEKLIQLTQDLCPYLLREFTIKPEHMNGERARLILENGKYDLYPDLPSTIKGDTSTIAALIKGWLVDHHEDSKLPEESGLWIADNLPIESLLDLVDELSNAGLRVLINSLRENLPRTDRNAQEIAMLDSDEFIQRVVQKRPALAFILPLQDQHCTEEFLSWVAANSPVNYRSIPSSSRRLEDLITILENNQTHYTIRETFKLVPEEEIKTVLESLSKPQAERLIWDVLWDTESQGRIGYNKFLLDELVQHHPRYLGKFPIDPDLFRQEYAVPFVKNSHGNLAGVPERFRSPEVYRATMNCLLGQERNFVSANVSLIPPKEFCQLFEEIRAVNLHKAHGKEASLPLLTAYLDARSSTLRNDREETLKIIGYLEKKPDLFGLFNCPEKYLTPERADLMVSSEPSTIRSLPTAYQTSERWALALSAALAETYCRKENKITLSHCEKFITELQRSGQLLDVMDILEENREGSLTELLSWFSSSSSLNRSLINSSEIRDFIKTRCPEVLHLFRIPDNLITDEISNLVVLGNPYKILSLPESSQTVTRWQRALEALAGHAHFNKSIAPSSEQMREMVEVSHQSGKLIPALELCSQDVQSSCVMKFANDTEISSYLCISPKSVAFIKENYPELLGRFAIPDNLINNEIADLVVLGKPYKILSLPESYQTTTRWQKALEALAGHAHFNKSIAPSFEQIQEMVEVAHQSGKLIPALELCSQDVQGSCVEKFANDTKISSYWCISPKSVVFIEENYPELLGRFAIPYSLGTPHRVELMVAQNPALLSAVNPDLVSAETLVNFLKTTMSTEQHRLLLYACDLGDDVMLNALNILETQGKLLDLLPHIAKSRRLCCHISQLPNSYDFLTTKVQDLHTYITPPDSDLTEEIVSAILEGDPRRIMEMPERFVTRERCEVALGEVTSKFLNNRGEPVWQYVYESIFWYRMVEALTIQYPADGVVRCLSVLGLRGQRSEFAIIQQIVAGPTVNSTDYSERIKYMLHLTKITGRGLFARSNEYLSTHRGLLPLDRVVASIARGDLTIEQRDVRDLMHILSDRDVSNACAREPESASFLLQHGSPQVLKCLIEEGRVTRADVEELVRSQRNLNSIIGLTYLSDQFDSSWRKQHLVPLFRRDPASDKSRFLPPHFTELSRLGGYPEEDFTCTKNDRGQVTSWRSRRRANEYEDNSQYIVRFIAQEFGKDDLIGLVHQDVRWLTELVGTSQALEPTELYKAKLGVDTGMPYLLSQNHSEITLKNAKVHHVQAEILRSSEVLDASLTDRVLELQTRWQTPPTVEGGDGYKAQHLVLQDIGRFINENQQRIGSQQKSFYNRMTHFLRYEDPFSFICSVVDAYSYAGSASPRINGVVSRILDLV
jgi:hypothetical protein